MTRSEALAADDARVAAVGPSLFLVTAAVRAHRRAQRVYDHAMLARDFGHDDRDDREHKAMWLAAREAARDDAIIAASKAGAVLAEVVAAYDAGVREETTK